jgi:hypothetical protein
MIGRRRDRMPVRCRSSREENMAQFLYVYHGSGKMPTTEVERKAMTDAWTGWFAKLGSAVVDRGNPVGMSKSVLPGGKIKNNGGSNPTGGYSIIEARDIDDAASKARDCPILAEPNCNVEIAPIINMMG